MQYGKVTAPCYGFRVDRYRGIVYLKKKTRCTKICIDRETCGEYNRDVKQNTKKCFTKIRRCDYG